MDDIVEGAKAFAALLDMSPAMVREELATYPDPLPAWRLRGGRIWSRRSQLLAWGARHPRVGRRRSDDVRHPLPGLVVVSGRAKVARVVRLRWRQVLRLLPWSPPPPPDPIPAWRNAEGVVCAYRCALLDWLDRQSVASSSPRFRRRWESKLVTERKRRKGCEREAVSETAPAHTKRQAARMPDSCQEGSKVTAQKVRRAA